MGKQTTIEPDAGVHRPRLQTTDFRSQEIAIRAAIARWWDGASGRCTTTTADDQALTTLLKEAAGAFGSVAGYTSAPKGPRPRWIKGHRALLRDINALGVLKKVVAGMLSTHHAMLQLPDTSEVNKMWKRVCKRVVPEPPLPPLPRRAQVLHQR